MMKNKKSASALISDLKRKTRKAYNSEDKTFFLKKNYEELFFNNNFYNFIFNHWL